jgi:glutamate racemase
MKIGIFDSGLGGLIIARAIRKAMPEYDYVYFGDTARLPYGNKPQKAVLEYTKEAVDHLFRKENCAMVIVACNTASSRALRKIQQEYLPKHFKDRKVLGVLIPAAEMAAKYERVGIIATIGTVASKTFPMEIKKINTDAKVFQNAAPMLVSLIEDGNTVLAKKFLLKYLKPLQNKKLDALVLGCTHYPLLKAEARKIMSKKVRVISQDEIIPKKLKEYLKRHPEINKKLSRQGEMDIMVTEETPNMNRLVKKWFGVLA